MEGLENQSFPHLCGYLRKHGEFLQERSRLAVNRFNKAVMISEYARRRAAKLQERSRRMLGRLEILQQRCLAARQELSSLSFFGGQPESAGIRRSGIRAARRRAG